MALVALGCAALCVAGVALGDIHLRFTWHLETSTFVSRGTRGTYGTGLALAARLDPPSLTQHLSHTTLSHTIFDRPLCHTPSLTHHLQHTTLSHTIFDTPLCHTPSFTHPLSHTIFVTYHLSHTIFHTLSFTPNSVTHHL